MGNYIFTKQNLKNESDCVQKHIYGWKKDKVDPRDLHHNFTISLLHSSIKHLDMRNMCPTVYDQEKLGSCTANAIGGAYEFDQIKQQDESPFTPSRLFIYYNERAYKGKTNKDSGASIRYGIKSVSKIGVCPEALWEYDITKFTEKPPEKCYADAKWHHVVKYKRVIQTLKQLKQCLLEGFPFIFGFIVYESFESYEVTKTGIMPIPEEDEQILGGHAVMACGFSDEKEAVLVRNSWGKNWGISGYFWMPYGFIINPEYCADFWTILRVVDKDNEQLLKIVNNK
jgi:C1A family cysteine protease